MLKTLIRLLRGGEPRANAAPPDPTSDQKPGDTPPRIVISDTASPNNTESTVARDRDDAAWSRYDDREIAGEYSWSYDGTTVAYGDRSWQFHEPDTFRPKPLDDRFYNELSPDHVNQLLAGWARAEQIRSAWRTTSRVRYRCRQQHRQRGVSNPRTGSRTGARAQGGAHAPDPLSTVSGDGRRAAQNAAPIEDTGLLYMAGAH